MTSNVADRETRKRAFEELSAALEEITVKSVVDFRNLEQPPGELERVALAVGGMVASLDEGPSEASAVESWGDVQKLMSKPGHFINSLRRFPYAVDSGRVPEKNIQVATSYFENGGTDDEASLGAQHPVGLNLQKWLNSALNYAKLRPSDSQAAPKTAPGPPPKTANAQQPAPLGGPKQADPGAVGIGGNAAGRKLEAKPVTRLSQARNPAKTAAAAPASAASPQKAPKAPVGGYAGTMRSAAPAAAPKVQSPAALSRGRQMADTQANAEDWQRMLETTKREVREIRALESQVKWKMLRDEKRQSVDDESNVDKELMEWRWNEQDTMNTYLEQKTQRLRLQELAENKDYQEFKRIRKAGEREQEKKWIEAQYHGDTEAAAWEAELAKAIQEEKKLAVQEHFEKYEHMKNYKASLRAQDQQETDDSRTMERAMEMDSRQKELVRQKEALLQSLEFARSCQGMPISTSGRTTTRHI